MRREHRDERAMDRAAEVYGIPRDEPGADEHLRKSRVYAWAALRFACRDLWDEFKASFRRGGGASRG